MPVMAILKAINGNTKGLTMATMAMLMATMALLMYIMTIRIVWQITNGNNSCHNGNGNGHTWQC